jgi:LacI family transcriptional regulator
VRSLSGKVDGLLMAEEVMPADQLRALARRVPIVLIAGPRAEHELDVVTVDNASGIRSLVAHLTREHGYRRLCFIGGPLDSPDAQERLAAFSQMVRDTPGCACDPVIHGDFSEASGSAAARALLARPSLPEVVACANDQMAIGVLREFQQAGIRLPSTVAVTGFDDIFPSRMVDPSLTTVSQPLHELGTLAAQRLLARIDGGAKLPPLAEVLPTQLVIRASCGCPPPGTR